MPESTMPTRFDSQPVFRFAPSPNGLLHLGHARSALINQQMAAAMGGRLLLRIEDIDLARCRPQFEEAIYADLRWLGLTWEEPVRRQSEHFDVYQKTLDRLIQRGLAYPAFLTRGEVKARVEIERNAGRQWPLDPDGAPHYPLDERGLSAVERDSRKAAGVRHTWRLNMQNALAQTGTLQWQEMDDTGRIMLVEADPSAWGDIVLSRSDAPSSYHLSVVVDDSLQGITHVVRGRDLYHATSLHRLLQALLGFGEPIYHHHSLILGPDGRKLSKSNRDTGIAAFREAGRSPADVRKLALGL